MGLITALIIVFTVALTLNFENNQKYFKENSYCFVINSDFLTSKYFFPNNQFPDYVTKYVRDITKS